MNERLRILCIEDNSVNWRLVQRLLSQAGYEMHWAEEGLKGYDMALELKPCLVLLDINLPGLSGFEVAAKFKQNDELKNIPLVALTAKTLKSDRETALVAGCEGFIPKPIDPFTFVKQVEGYLGGRREEVEKAREGAVLRQFNVQMLEHLEQQLKDAQEGNKKLLEAQQALESRNRSLSRLLFMSRSALLQHDPDVLLRLILEQVRTEIAAQHISAYRMHSSGGYWEGLRWNGEAFVDAPTLSLDHAFLLRARGLSEVGTLAGEKLKASRAWEEGIPLAFWKPGMECSLLLLRDRQHEQELWGFWTFAREGSERFQASELELMTLHASIAQVALENAELILNLNESSRALAESYERMETAFSDLQNAKADLSRQNRQALLEDLFYKITQRLQTPVTTLNLQSHVMDELIFQKSSVVLEACPPLSGVMTEIRGAVAKIDGLLKALLRRVGKGEAKPEWIDLHELLLQEQELLEAEGWLPEGVQVNFDLQALVPMLYGVYSDFAKILLNLVQHALGGPTPSPVLRIRTWRNDDFFHLEVTDEGGPIPPITLANAFEPFSELHQESIIGLREPGQGLAVNKQLLTTYHGEIEIRNEGEGTLVHLWFPLRG